MRQQAELPLSLPGGDLRQQLAGELRKAVLDGRLMPVSGSRRRVSWLLSSRCLGRR